MTHGQQGMWGHVWMDEEAPPRRRGSRPRHTYLGHDRWKSQAIGAGQLRHHVKLDLPRGHRRVFHLFFFRASSEHALQFFQTRNNCGVSVLHTKKDDIAFAT